jgi:uncharacterized protein
MHQRRTSTFAVAALALALGFWGCSGDDDITDPPKVVELDGPAVAVGNGTARAVVMKQGDDVESVGIQLTDDALANLPATMPMTEWQLALPSGANAGQWDHLALDWNPQGHPPPMVYTVPHFDFHFYMISPAEQSAIPGGPDETPVDAKYVPKDYASQVESVPMMGVHWADTLAAEYHGQPFDHTFIYGFHEGQMIFVEPMVTQEFLQSGSDFSGHVKQPAAFQTSGLYPTAYSVKHDPTHHTITIALDSLVTH